MKFIILMITIAFLSACSMLPKTFTTDNVMKVHNGMSSDEILNMFGKPTNVGQAVCGASTGHTWVCTTWEYGKFPYDRASFTFNADNPKALRLNSFQVDRD